MSFAKRVAVILLGGVILGITIWLGLRAEVGWLQAELAGQIDRQFHRSLIFGDNAKISFWRGLRLGVEHVSISEPGGQNKFAALDRLEVDFRLRSLFSGNVEIETISINGLRATVIRHPDGTLNIDDLLASDSESGGLPELHIENLHLTGSHFEWRDQRHHDTRAVDIALLGQNITMSTEKLAVEKLSLAFASPQPAPGIGVQGELALALTMDRAGRTVDLSRIDGLIAIDHPRAKIRPWHLSVQGSSKADLALPAATAALTAHLDETSLALQADLQRLLPPAGRIEVEIDRIDLDRYLTDDPDAARTGPPFILDGSGMEVYGTAAIGRLRLAGIDSEKLHLDFDTRKKRPERELSATTSAGSRDRTRPDGGTPPGHRGVR